MPIYEVNGRRANVKDGSTDKFLAKYPDAKLVEESQPDSTPQNSVNGGAILDTKPSTLAYKLPTYQSSDFEIPKREPFRSKSFSDVARETRDNMPISPEAMFDISADRYQQEKSWIDEVQNDKNISPVVKQALMDDYRANTRTNDTTIDDKDLPPAAKEWLERNKQPVVKRRWIPTNRSIGESGHWQEYTEKENTPEQKEFIKDYIANSAEGQQYARTHKEWIEGIESEIDPLLGQIEGIRAATKKGREEYAKRHNISTWTLKNTNPRNEALLNKASNLLKNTKQMLSANRDGGGFRKGLRMTDEDIRELLVLTESFYNDKALNYVIGKYEKDPNSLNEEENIVIQAKYIADQLSAGVDAGSWYNIGQTTKQSLPFMRDFILTAPIGGGAAKAVKAGAAKLASKAGANMLSGGVRNAVGSAAKGAIDLSVRPAVQTMFSPSSYAMALEEMQGQAIDRDEQGNVRFDNRKSLEHGVTSAFIENQSEVLGEVVLDKLFQKLRIPLPAFLKTNAAKRLSSATGIQGPLSEYAEEKYSDLVNIVRGEQTIEGFFDSRSNLETFGAVAIMQIPFSSINATGYGIGKIRDIQGKQAIRRAYEQSGKRLNEYFGEDSGQIITAFNEFVDSNSEEELKNALTSVIEDEKMDGDAKRAIVEYVTSYSAYSGINKAKQEQIQQAQEEAVQVVQDNANPQMSAVVSAVIGGYESPMQVVGGNIVLNEEGGIDREMSDQSVTILNEEGKRVPVSIKFVESLSENIPTPEAVEQAAQIVAEPVIAQQENDEVRPYEVGEVVTADVYGNGITFTGEIAGVTEDGNYVVVDVQSGQQVNVEPRRIINQDNIQGVDDGSLIEYRNEKGETKQGVVGSMYALRPQGMITLENGEAIPISDVIGLAQQTSEQVASPGEEALLSADIPAGETATTQEGNTTLIEQIPQDDKGNLLFEQVPTEITIGALGEVYSDVGELSGVVDATVSNIRKQIEKAKTPKPTGDINKDIANKRAANQQIGELNDRLSYWESVKSSIQRSQPIEQRVTEQLTGEKTPKAQPKNKKKPGKANRNTPFQRRLNTVEENVHSIRDRVLFGIASGGYKFRWKDEGVSMGLARELGLSGSETERRARIGLLSNSGYTPTSLVHHLWEEMGTELNDNDIRSEIIDVLNSITSRNQALEALENNVGMTEERYLQEQEEASEYEAELRKEDEAMYNEMLEQINKEHFVSLRDEASSLGATPEQIEDARSFSDFIDLIEQLQDGRQEQTSDSGGNREQAENVDGEGIAAEQTQRNVGGRNRPAKETGAERQDSDSKGKGIEFSTEEQRVVNETNKRVDEDIAKAEKELTTLQGELSAARKKIGRAQVESQGDLFGKAQQQSTLFDVPADLSRENVVDNILNPIKERINVARSVLDNLNNGRDARVQEALDAHRRQGNLLDEIARAEAETNTNPTEAQKEAGNYKKGKVTIHGFDISIEQPQGSVRSGVDENGKQWSVTMNNTYGYIRKTEGKDGDHIDVFLGSNPESARVFVVDQVNQDGSFDEHKVMLGFGSIEEARSAYLSNYEDGWQGLGNITEVDADTFRKWAESDTRRIKPFAEYKEIRKESASAYGASNTLVSTEAYEELRKRMRDKLNNLNVGFDPELFTIGTQMAMYHIEAGARRFADFAGRMVADLGGGIRPYLKSLYESARHAPGMERLSKEMDLFNEVNAFDLENLTIFEQSNTSNNNSDETNRDIRSDNSSVTNGRASSGTTVTDVREQPGTTETEDRGKSTESPTLERSGTKQRGESGRGTGNNADATGTGLHSAGTETNTDNGRKDTGNTNGVGKHLNTNNNRQARGENVVPRGSTAKINANIAAIKLAKRLFETGKKATPEQMNVLRRYTGWGGLSSVFRSEDKSYQALRDVLTHEEYESARASTTTAFYTPQEITSSVWDMVEKLGFKGGNILEPSAGIGNFFALMPEHISNASQLRGVELDTISGTILKLLYPDAKIDIAGFEKQRIANNSIDLVVSNVPFGNFKVHDAFDKDLSSQFDIHDYFIAKSIRKLKAGGIGVFITTSSTLDKSSSLRNWIINNGNADFIDAVRLNTETFKNDAGTEATADIIIVRKRDTSGRSSFEKNMQDSVVAREATYMQQEKNKWGYNTGEVEKKARMTYNKYFIDNPHRLSGEMMFGFEGGNAIRPTEQRLAPTKEISQQEVIDRMIADLPSDIYDTTPAEQVSKAVANNGTKEGGLTIIDGQAYVVRFDSAIPVDWNSNKVSGYEKAEILNDYIGIKNAIDGLLEAENNNMAGIEKLRNGLNAAYDKFVNKYGTLNENRKIIFLQDDVDFSSVSAIENIEDGQRAGEKIITKSDIFSKRVIDKQADPKADNIIDAVRVSMNQNGRVDIPYIARLINRTNDEVQLEIVGNRLGFVNPETGLVESRNQYLSGNVRDKLSIAQQANEGNEYDTNIEELSKVIPTDIPINLIKMTLGSTWLPSHVYSDFFKETFDVNANIRKTPADKFVSNLSGKGNAKDIQMGMPEAGGSVLALNAMNNTTTTIYMQVWEDGRRKTVTDPLKTAQAAAKQTELSEIFEAWIKQKKEYAEELENIYNNTFNAIVNPKIDVDSFDRFPGVGGKLVALEKANKESGGEVNQFRLAKENLESDNAHVMSIAKDLGIGYNTKTGIFSVESNSKAGQFMKEANGAAKILRQHQKEGVIRGLEGATLLAHEVGTGKTLTLITTAMEMRRLGLAKKPTIVVQRSTYKQFVKEIKNQYPNAKVLAPSAKDLSAKQRQQLFAKIAYNDWDIVVLYHSYLDSIPDDARRVAQYIDERIQEKMDLLEEMELAKGEGATNAGRMIGSLKKEIQRLELERNNTLNPGTEEDGEAEGKSKRKRSVKDIEKVRANAETKAERSLDRRTDNTMTFEQLGIDALLVDEAHAYKKLGFVTSLQRVKGIDTSESKRAQSTKLKTSYILENHNGKNVVFATGTPISNTMAEMWTFLRYLLPKTEISRLQMNNFDAFVNNFGSIEESAEFGTNGKFRVTNRFSSYSNVPELIAAWRQIAHSVLTEEVSTLKEGVGTPRVEGGKPSDVMLEQTAPLKSVMKAIKNKLEWFANLSGAEKKENTHIPLVMFGLAKRAAIDVRLVDPTLPDDANSKTNIAVGDILKDLKDTESYKGTIAIFCDSYQSSDKTFNVFRDIKQKLIDNGISAEQIAIINDFEKDEAKEKLFTSVNSGDIRVVMGTTEKLGVGVNIQERLHMAGHLDAPLRPSDYQQRNGRIIRQGNTHLNMDKSVKIVRWGVKKTLDVTGYQRLEIKKKFIDQIMKGDISQRMIEESDIESTDSANFNQMMANLSGSQAALALSVEQNKLKKLHNAKQYHNDNQIYMSGAVKRAKSVIESNTQAIEKLERYKKAVQSSIPGGIVTEVSIGNVTANTPDDISVLLNKHITKKVDSEVEALRNDFLRENSQVKTSISVNGIKLDIAVDINRSYDVDSRKTRITREIRYVSTNNTVENPFFSREDHPQEKHNRRTVPLFNDIAGANIQNVIGQINYELSGRDIDNDIQKYKIGVEKAKRDIGAYEPQIGHEFSKEKELQDTAQKVADLEEQMKEELKAIEAEEANEKVDTVDIDELVVRNSEDNPDNDPTPPTGGRRQTASSGAFSSTPAKKFDRLVDKLNQTGLATDVVIEKNINDSRDIQDKEGNVYGYVTPEGVIHLDAQNMNANTPIHEFGHLWVSFTKANDSALYNRATELIKQSPYWERVNNNPDYTHLPESEKINEALAWSIGDKGEAITNRGMKQRFIDWLAELWKSVKQAFGIDTSAPIEDMTLSDFTDRAVGDLLGGERLTDTSATLDNVQLQSVHDLVKGTNSVMTEEVRNQLDRKLKDFRVRLREQWEDRHLPVKVFLDTLREKGASIAEYNDYYKQATHINGRIDAQLERYNEEFQRPLNKAIANLEKAGLDYRAIENYAILKHGIERNEWMRKNAIEQYMQDNPEATQEQIDKFAARLPDDFSGITAVQEEVGMSAGEFISEFEDKAGSELTDDFWKKIKAATSFSLQKQKEGGLIDRKTFDELTARYEYYIPLRGHDAEVAEDRWDYAPNMGTYFVAPLIKAKGRKTRSESPFAFIFSMAQTSINSSNRNVLNQTILRLANQDKTGLFGVNKAWYVQTGLDEEGKPIYEVQSPTYSEDAEQYSRNIEEFEARMEKLKEEGLAIQSGSKLNIGGLFIKRNQSEQHDVHVYQNGTEYVVHINANPAVARAITGDNAKDLHKDLRFIARTSRQMAANFTTRNPIFVLSNFSRDYIFASSILPVKEDAKYALQFQRNMPKAAGALQRYIRGKSDLSKQQDRYVIEYIMNGAKTGFSHIVELQRIQKQIEREIKKGDKTNAFRTLLSALESCNEFAENLSRLSVYITSREQRRSIVQSVSDAKEVTVNFNRNGAGGWGAAWFRSLYLFVNAGIQALSNISKVAQKNKGKTAVLMSSYAMSGFLMPMLTALIGGDDGMDEYMKLSDWERQNNLCIYTGNGFIKIPLPHELRVFHSMGDNIYQAAFGKKDVTESLLDITTGFSDLIPANPMGSIQGSWADVMPDAMKPFFQLAANKNFTGGRITNEWADPNKPGYLRVRANKKGEPFAPAFLMKLAESLDISTGGDGVEKGLISFNPDEVNHILRGYFGGLYSIGMQVLDLSAKVYDWTETGEFKLKVRETPLKAFYTSSDDLQTSSSGLNSKYFKIADDIQEIRRKIKGYQEQATKGQIGIDKFSNKIQEMADDVEKYRRIYPYMKRIKKFETALKELDNEQQKEAEKIISDLKKEVIEINSMTGK